MNIFIYLFIYTSVHGYHSIHWMQLFPPVKLQRGYVAHQQSGGWNFNFGWSIPLNDSSKPKQYQRDFHLIYTIK